MESLSWISRTVGLAAVPMGLLIVCLVFTGCGIDSENAAPDVSSAARDTTLKADAQTRTDSQTMVEAATEPKRTVIRIDTTRQTRLGVAEADSLLARPGAVSICSRLDSLWVTNALGAEKARSSPTVMHVVSGGYRFDIQPHRIVGGGMVDDRTYDKYASEGMVYLDYDKGLFREGTCGLLTMELYGPNWTDFIVYGDGGNTPRQARFAEGMLALHLVDSTMVIDLQSKTGRITYKVGGLGRIRVDSLAEPILLPEPLNGVEMLRATQKLPRLNTYQCDQVKVYTDGTMMRKNFRYNIYSNVLECIDFIEKSERSDNPDSFETDQVGVRKRNNIEFSFHNSMTG